MMIDLSKMFQTKEECHFVFSDMSIRFFKRCAD